MRVTPWDASVTLREGQGRDQPLGDRWGGGSGGFFLACEDLGKMFDNLFPAYTFLFFLNGD